MISKLFRVTFASKEHTQWWLSQLRSWSEVHLQNVNSVHCKLDATTQLWKHSLGQPISCFSKVLPFPSYGEALCWQHEFPSSVAPFACPCSVVISPPLWFLSLPLQVLPSPASLPTMDRKLGRAAHKCGGGRARGKPWFHTMQSELLGLWNSPRQPIPKQMPLWA